VLLLRFKSKTVVGTRGVPRGAGRDVPHPDFLAFGKIFAEGENFGINFVK
jgi:hypothetical protein